MARASGSERARRSSFVTTSVSPARREALRLRHNYIGTEHIRLGLLREGEGLAARILPDSGVSAEELRRSVLAAIGKVA